MLMEVKNQFRISFLSVKYALMREMLNKTTFITNVLFMILNNASFIIQWIVLFSLKDNVGGYTFDQVMLLWGLSAGTYGVSHFFFSNSYHLSELINNGKLDSFLVQPKNVLISVITTDVTTSALGDIIYGYLMVLIFGLTPLNLLLFTIFSILGGIILTSVSVILNRCDSSTWVNWAGNTPYKQVIKSGQFEVYFKGYYQSYMPGGKYYGSSKYQVAKQAVIDGFNGIRNNSYLGFRSWHSTGYSSKYIISGGNRYGYN